MGEHIETTVDSEMARYYLEEYLPDKNGAGDLHEKIAVVYRQYDKALPSREELAAISREFSVDFASLFFADRLLSNECNKQLNQSFVRYLANKKATDVDTSAYLVLFVPGWDYVKNGHETGADFAQPRRLATQFGLENYSVELPPTGSVEQSAEVLAAEIVRRSQAGKKLIIAGASSAGPAIHLALSDLLGEKELRSVKAWLNLGGILQGSPLIDYLQLRPQRWLFNLVAWFKGWDRDSIMSMATTQSRKRFEHLHIDADILILNYLGIPLSGQLSKYSKDKYPLLKADGPNELPHEFRLPRVFG